MKKVTIILSVLIAMTIKTTAQIPNSGFENWTTVGNYQDPTFWGSTNSYSTGPFYAVTRSTDHYPVAVGNYSVRIENNTALSPHFSGRGFVSTGPPPPSPDFRLPAFWPSGNPSLTGYYKFAPLNGDTMLIQIHLFRFGSTVFSGAFATTASAPNWTSFNIPIPPFLLADSGSIILAAYYANGFDYLPHGNSVLYVDNLNFDSLITSVPLSSSEVPSKFSLAQNYPNPFNPSTTIEFELPRSSFVKLVVVNVLGQEVATLLGKQLVPGRYRETFNAINHSSGVYFYKLQTSEVPIVKKMLLLR